MNFGIEVLFLRERPSHFFGASRLAPVDGRLSLIFETRMPVASVTISMTRTYLMHSKHLKWNPSCPQVAFQDPYQPQPPRIDLGPDHDQCQARLDRYAELFELQICVSHGLDIWEENGNKLHS